MRICFISRRFFPAISGMSVYAATKAAVRSLARSWTTDLKARGIPPGPKYTEILRRLRAAWLDGEVKTAEEEEALLNTIL